MIGKPIICSSEATVVAKYEPGEKKRTTYESEEALENCFLGLLHDQGYELVDVTDETTLIENLRKQIEKLNDYTFTDQEWQWSLDNVLAKKTDGPAEKTERIQRNSVYELKRDDGTIKNIKLIDKDDIHNNILQVTHQYKEDSGRRKVRYDVTVLVNGLPLVHIELKQRSIPLEDAFNQNNRYGRDAFWASKGFYEYVQIFVISNGTETKYYSNSARYDAANKSESAKTSRAGNSFEFTSYWADAENRNIFDLIDFTQTFFCKHTLLNILTKYCVFTVDKKLLVMRPYQITATERILNRIDVAYNNKYTGTIDAGGYIWHTTGSGKTLTSFKTAQLATQLPYIEKVIFVVDRKDLDYQTMKEYDKFEKGAADGNTSTKKLQEQLENPESRIIITTIQKLNKFILKNKTHDIYNKHVVLVFDECHRSQFGTMHSNIIKAFKKYYIFGFTGTPIFTKNSDLKKGSFKTTEQMFGRMLHSYTVIHAINDRNVLPLRVAYADTMKENDHITDKKVQGIDTKEPIYSKERIRNIVKTIIDDFDIKTFHKKCNSIFAVESIEMAKLYYEEFKRQMKEVEPNKRLSFAIIYSFAPNSDELDGLMEENSDDTSGLTKSDRDFLDDAIEDYNTLFKTRFDTSSNEFQGYYKDVSKKMKEKKIDVLIVVNMFLTGFDAPKLNTLWVDKNLQYHGLIQSFSRTNRIWDSVKKYGNIVSFRNLKQKVDEAFELFGDKKAKGIVLLKTFDDYYDGYEDDAGFHMGYKGLVEKIKKEFPINDEIFGERKKKEFIDLFNKLLKVENILTSFPEFKDKKLMTDFEKQNYKGKYLGINRSYRKEIESERESILNDIHFEMELFEEDSIGVDYIMDLLNKKIDDRNADKVVDIDAVEVAIKSSLKLESKKDLIEKFLKTYNASGNAVENAPEKWIEFEKHEKEEDIEKLIKEERLKPEETRKFLADAWQRQELLVEGTGFANILPKMSRFLTGDENRDKIKDRISIKIKELFDRYSE